MSCDASLRKKRKAEGLAQPFKVNAEVFSAQPTKANSVQRKHRIAQVFGKGDVLIMLTGEKDINIIFRAE